MAETSPAQIATPSLRRMLIPLALAQFICSFAGSNMNVMINDISIDLHTTVQGVQVSITLFLLVMAGRPAALVMTARSGGRPAGAAIVP